MNLRLETLPGQNFDGTARVFRLVECWPTPGVYLRTDIGLWKHPTVASALHRLGAMVEWHRWTPETRAVLLSLNEGKAI